MEKIVKFAAVFVLMAGFCIAAVLATYNDYKKDTTKHQLKIKSDSIEMLKDRNKVLLDSIEDLLKKKL
jgi:large-conductance mechanosensitive channel